MDKNYFSVVSNLIKSIIEIKNKINNNGESSNTEVVPFFFIIIIIIFYYLLFYLGKK